VQADTGGKEPALRARLCEAEESDRLAADAARAAGGHAARARLAVQLWRVRPGWGHRSKHPLPMTKDPESMEAALLRTVVHKDRWDPAAAGLRPHTVEVTEEVRAGGRAGGGFLPCNPKGTRPALVWSRPS
jgi:hypothetical protein